MTGTVDLGLQAGPTEATKAPLPVIEVSNLDATLSCNRGWCSSH